ncbi:MULTISPECIES: SMI1/KNR4 family protein [unclassified Sutcliffiella]|uniref:SMI1/KNR4 family protein n=1 Tax=unclassified Sutcliffiella TaxID=2837532 RepID=UPI0030CB736C
MQAIKSFKKRLIENKLLVQREDGYVEEETFHFYPPASETDLAKLPDYTPKDLITFLEHQNGAELFVHPEDGGGAHLFSADEIIEHMKTWECPDSFLPIGVGLDGIWIVCQCDKNSDDNSVWIGEFLNYEDEFEKLAVDYSTWLERFIIAQGASYWDWFR